MVVLDHLNSTSTTSEASRMSQYLSSQYVQPLPHEEMDSKVSPLAMLTQACNKIESSMLGMANKTTSKPALSPLRESPKRARSNSSEEGEPSSPSLKQPRLSTPQEKVSQPLASSEKRKTPERRPSTTSSASVASPSSAAVTSRASSQPSLYPSAFPPMLPPGYPPFAGAPTAHVGPCTNPMCTDVTCPTGAARASFLMGLPPHPSMSLLSLMHPPPALAGAAAPPASPYVCNWMAGGEFCGRRFDSSEDLMSHLRTHTAAASTASSAAAVATSTATSLAALQAAQAALISSTVAPVMSTSTSASALAALQAQAAKMAASPSSSAASTDLAAAAAARYHAALVTRPGLPPPPPIPALPPHLASLYGLGNPYSMPMIYPMP